jgi:hypothetical protein
LFVYVNLQTRTNNSYSRYLPIANHS